MELEIEYRDIEALIPYARNARTHSDAQVAQIAASIREFGFVNPILVDGENGIVAGHGRVMAARKLGMPTVPVIELAHLTTAQRRSYIIADNKLALNAGWDEDLLRVELADLKIDGFDLELTGFSDLELSALNPEPEFVPQDDEDSVPEPPEVPVSKRGDVWLLGGHRLMCGDSTDAGEVEKLMAGHRCILMQTDPPYGVSHVKTKDGIPRSGFSDMATRWEHIKNDDLENEKLQAFLEEVFRNAVAFALFPNAAWYLWHAHLTQGFFAAAAAAAAADLLLHRQIIWVKPSMVLTRSGMYHWRHELCFYGWVRGNQPPWYGNKSQTSIWELGRDQNMIHPTQKPVAIWETPIANHTKPGEAMYEPFCGSGSQIIAAEKHGRICYAMELSERYVDAAVLRWQDYTGKVVTLESTGEPFPCRD
jgi:DNA modification methylase